MCCHPVILVGTSGEGLDMESYNYIKGCTWVREFRYTVPHTCLPGIYYPLGVWKAVFLWTGWIHMLLLPYPLKNTSSWTWARLLQPSSLLAHSLAHVWNMQLCVWVGLFCNGGGFLSAKECFQWDRVPSILPMRTKSQGNEVILSTYYHPNLIRTTPLLIEFCLSKFKTKNQVS